MWISLSRSTPRLCPSEANTPITRNRTPAIVICWPTASRPLNSAWATPAPSTATRRWVSTSDRFRYVPRARVRTKTLGVLSVTPLTVANVCTFPERTVSPDATVAATRFRSPTILATSSTSSRLSREIVGADPKLTWPGTTTSRLEPRPSTCCSILFLVPVPMATRITTAATPMITPSMVRPLRSRLARRASSATRHASANLMWRNPSEAAANSRSAPLRVSCRDPSCDQPVAHDDLAVGPVGHLAVVGDDHQGHPALEVELFEQGE